MTLKQPQLLQGRGIKLKFSENDVSKFKSVTVFDFCPKCTKLTSRPWTYKNNVQVLFFLELFVESTFLNAKSS